MRLTESRRGTGGDDNAIRPAAEASDCSQLRASEVGRGFAFDCCPGPELGCARLGTCCAWCACRDWESGRSELASQSVLHEVFRRQAELKGTGASALSV